ncbi:KDO2-lipid IV(A) lauroyltransferase [Rhabdobacter roseus]|uniref:KDO2-lipid IV(A) lauroyltransferase n=2 Tax=Rhabdobacter roseus TaxID=1655419 RepID=A0A840U161_9BACT|nr:KDO2-lipid IV(A) lauroyltransferase [Rhabdobacter roseus]
MKNLTTRFLLFLFTVLSRQSWRTLYRLSDLLKYLIFDLVGYRKDVVLVNLRNSFPEKEEAEIQKIARDYSRNLTDLVVEAVKLRSITREEVNQRFTYDPRVFEHYYAQNKNLVLVLGHLGNWELANLFASLNFPHQVVVVYHRLANDTFEDWFYKIRTQFGSELVPMNEAYQKAGVPRQRPFMFLLVNDQSPRPDKAYWTTFLNQDTGVFRGVERIARQLDAPVLYGVIGRDENRRGHYTIGVRLITENPKEIPNNGILERQIKLLEADIRRQPANWLWSHKRWKHPRPAQLQPDQVLEVNFDCEKAD